MAVEDKWCVVTGGRGFAARHLVEMLIRQNEYCVRIADLEASIVLEPAEQLGLLGQALHSGRAQYVSLDLRNKAQVLKALEGVEVVFHMAAPNSSINNYQLHHSVNVQGTKNVIDACVELNVKRLVYTSSPSVVFDGVHGINGNETMPYAHSPNDHYSATKAEGEALVIKANGTNGLLTCCIRPSSIFGPGDRLLVPSLVDAARKGKSKFIIGDGNNVYDFTYVENVAHAHICADQALVSEGPISEKAAGEAKNKDPYLCYHAIAHLVEWIYRLLGPYGMKVPQLTPSRIRLTSCSRTFDCSKAKDRLGYAPIVTLQLPTHCFGRIKSKLSSHYWGLLLRKYPNHGFTYQKIVSSNCSLSGLIMEYCCECFEIPCRGNDWVLFFKVVLSLFILSFLGAFSLQSLYTIGVTFAFIAFYVYEQKEEDIDDLFIKTHSFGCKLKSDLTRKFLSSKKID
ncbi:hypothetical protein JHK82_018120 [Glycine max]|nr:hypothetical protein JHK82_018120 [Glycine max]